MMDVSQPASSVSPGLHGRVLVVLARAVEALTGREVARRAGASQRGVARVLDELVADGLVERTEHPPAALFVLNDDHLAAPIAHALAGLRRTLYERIAEHVAGWDPPAVSVAVFGSFARGDGGRESDVDLLVVTPEGADVAVWDERLGELGIAVTRWTGNQARLITYSPEDLRQAAAGSVPFVDDLRRDAVTAAGTPLHSLLGVEAPRW